MTRLLRVLVIEEQSEFSGSIREYIEANFSPVSVIEVGSGEDALEVLNLRSCDLVLLDACIPGIDSIETARSISSKHPACRLIMLLSSGDPQMMERARDAGVSDFVMKQNVEQALRDVWNN